jgi:TatD DNase family protein
MWIDTHCHLDAAEFDADRDAVRQRARDAGVSLCVIPAVERANWARVREVAHRYGDVYALGIHPLYVPQAQDEDLQALDELLTASRGDPRLVAVGEIGLDYFVPALCEPAQREKQWRFYTAQLKLARKHSLPVILHVRRSADMLLKGLRQTQVKGGIAHAFNGSLQQAQAFIELGFVLGFGGAMTFERATQLRHLAATLPLSAIVLETDAPDIPPQWIYRTAEQRVQGLAQGRNEPGELPSIAKTLAQLRSLSPTQLSMDSLQNVQTVLRQLTDWGTDTLNNNQVFGNKKAD